MIKLKQVLISHPGKQHVHQLCLGLQKNNNLYRFITTIWYKPNGRIGQFLKFLPSLLKNKLLYILNKRFFAHLDEEKIETYPWYEMLRQFGLLLFNFKGEKWVFWVERFHDRHVAKKLGKDKVSADIIIGYEKSCFKTFRVAKQKNMITILDLAQVHFNHIDHLRNQYPMFKSIMDDSFLKKINDTKAKEYLYTDYVITLSTYAKQSLLDAHIPDEKIFTVNLGIDPNKFTPKKCYRKTGIFKVLFVGSILRRKGIHLLLEAFRQLNLTDAKLEIIGTISDGESLLKSYEGLYDHFPFMHHDELVQKYQDADIFVFPSYLDSWAQTVVESMACGTPVIVSSNTGAKDLVIKGGGFVVPVDNLEVIKDKINYLYSNRNKVEELGREASRIASCYTWEKYHDQIKEIIDKI